jgi:hypothetical protein
MHCPAAMRRVVVVPILLLSATANAGIVEDLQALTAAASDGGSAITEAEAAQFAASASRYSADESILGIVVAGGLRTTGHFPSDAAYGAILQALRFRVVGLAVTLRQAPATTFARVGADELVVTFDPRGVGYTRVDIAYSWDRWSSATLSAGRDGRFRGTLPGAPARGRLTYALHLYGADGNDFWINNPEELGVYRGTAHLDFSLDLAATFATPDIPSTPAFVQLLDTFTDPASPGGAAITGDEFSLLVEEITWEGGTAVDQRSVLVPVLGELDRLEQAGAVASDLAANMRTFLQNQIRPTATFPGAHFQRGVGGRLEIVLDGADFTRARVYYSTDGWDTPHVTECTRICGLGDIPSDALIAYTIAFDHADGSTSWVRSALGNFFQEVP